MKAREFILIATAAVAGFLGGIISRGAVPVFAKDNVPKTITAERFVVQDSHGNVRAEMGPDGLRLYGDDGRLVWKAPGVGVWPAPLR